MLREPMQHPNNPAARSFLLPGLLTVIKPRLNGKRVLHRVTIVTHCTHLLGLWIIMIPALMSPALNSNRVLKPPRGLHTPDTNFNFSYLEFPKSK